MMTLFPDASLAALDGQLSKASTIGAWLAIPRICSRARFRQSAMTVSFTSLSPLMPGTCMSFEGIENRHALVEFFMRTGFWRPPAFQEALTGKSLGRCHEYRNEWPQIILFDFYHSVHSLRARAFVAANPQICDGPAMPAVLTSTLKCSRLLYSSSARIR